MKATFTLVDAGGSARDLLVQWSGAATVGQLVSALGLCLPYESASVWLDGRATAAGETLQSAGLVDGAVLSLSSAAGARSDPASGLHLAVVGGPAAGAVAELHPGRYVVGRAPDCDIRVEDRTVSGHHLLVEVDPSGAVIAEDMGSSNGTIVGGRRIEGRMSLPAGRLVAVGDSFIEFREGAPADAVLHPAPGGLELRRPPRLRPARPGTDIVWPQEPAPPAGHSVPLASALVPLLLGGLLFAFTGQALMLLFVLMSPLLAFTTAATDRRSGRSRYKAEMAAYRETLAGAEARAAEALQAEGAERRAASPDAASLAATLSGPRRRLWERRAGDDDFLELRTGLANLPSTVRKVSEGSLGADPPEPLVAAAVPCLLSLPQAGVIGVAGPSDPAGPVSAPGVAAWLVAQAVALSGPADLRLAVLAGPGGPQLSGMGEDSPDPVAEARWGWTRWLPHVAAPTPGAAAALGTTRSTIETRARELAELVEQRHRTVEARPGERPERQWPAVLAVLDRAHDVRRVPGMDIVLQRGPAVAVYAVCVEEAEAYLPSECKAVISLDGSGRGTLQRSGEADLGGIALEQVSGEWCEQVARRMAPLRDPEVRAAGGSIPASVRLTDLVDPAAAIRSWAESGRSTRAVVGVGIDGPFEIDLRADGPHGLVAGTTGSGKSEFLQTLVASLALVNRPDALSFLLVDYKGGSAFRDCARLPHTAGVVTDLDPHLTERALVSLSAELKRREEILAAAGAKDIDDYVAMARSPRAGGTPAPAPLPRLVIVIDEFAGLVAELPDFVSGLVGIAQRGRSLGIHLILATQRPSGVVSPEIRANTNLRVALRVTSPAESADIIDAPDAARLSPANPGRAYALTGHSSLSLFQSARVGGPAAPAGGEAGPELSVAPAGWSVAGKLPRFSAVPPAAGSYGAAALAAAVEEAADPADTDLSRLASALIDAARAAGTGRQPRPWLPPLPEELPLSALDPPAPRSPGEPQAVPVGLVDLPEAQAQRPLLYDIATARHLLVGGAPGSGRTTFLRTLACAAAGANHPADLWMYVIDCGGGELRRLATLPHCGAVVTRAEPDRTDRLLSRLRSEMNRRLDLLALGGFTDLAEQRAASAGPDRLPYVAVLVDRWEGFMSAFDPVDGGRLTEALLDLAREGGSVGIRMVVTGDRSVLLGKLSGIVEDRLCLALAELSDYSLAGLDPRRVPPSMRPGRAVRSGDQAEVQIAVPGEAASGAAQTAAIAALAARWNQQQAAEDGAFRPFRVDPLPARVTLQEIPPAATAAARSPTWALVGLGGDELHPIGVDLAATGGGFVVAGPRRSGRSTALVVMSTSLLEGGSSLIALCPRTSPLRSLRRSSGVIGVLDGDDPPAEGLLELLNAARGPLAVVVDDAPLLHGHAVSELLEMVARDGPDQGHSMVIAGTPDELLRPMRGFIVEVRQARAGLLLCPESHLHAEVVGARLPRSATFSQPPGRGILIDDRRQVAVQVPLPDPVPEPH